jgi:hypothetical protein
MAVFSTGTILGPIMGLPQRGWKGDAEIPGTGPIDFFAPIVDALPFATHGRVALR